MADIALRGRAIERDRILTALQNYGVYGALVVLLIIGRALNRGFLEASNILIQLYQVTPVLVVALGMALVIGTEGIDLSVGAVIALASAMLPLYLGYGVWVAILSALVMGVVSGMVSGFLVAVVGAQPIVATLALMIGVRGVAVILNGNDIKPINDPTISSLGIGTWLLSAVPKMAWIAAVVVLVVWLMIKFTRFGRQLVAIGDNRRAAQLAGIPVKRALFMVYVISGVLAAFAGILISAHGGSADPADYGLNYELMAITAVVVGGTPLSGGKIRVVGTVAGALFMQLLTATLIQHNVPQSYTQMVEAAIICIAVYFARGRSGR